MTTVKVDYYKSTGKWYTSYEFQTETPAYDTTGIQDEIEEKYRHSEMSYTMEASDEIGGINKYLFEWNMPF